MRLTLACFKKPGRRPQNEKKVPFQSLLPLKLKDRVSGKGEQRPGAACLEEMSGLLTCLQENNYDNNMCIKQLELFRKCNAEFEKTTKTYKEMRQKEEPTPNSLFCTHKQITYLLRKYPTK